MKKPYKWQRRTCARRAQITAFGSDIMRARAEMRLRLMLKSRSPFEIVKLAGSA
jgi:hypothetical protein